MNEDRTHILQSNPAAMTAAIGQHVAGRYRLDHLIRRGDQGSVWRAVDLADGAQVALKLLRSGRQSDPASRGRFEREAHLLTRLVHPNVVRLLDWGVARDNEWYLALELLEGQRLDQRLADGRLRSREVRALAMELLQGLSEAHALGIVHGAVTSDNVMLVATGAKLIDWSIATRRHPEQTEDVRAVGALLFEALVGTPMTGDATFKRDGQTFCGPLVELLSRMLDPAPASRPSTPEALELLAAMPRPYVYRVT